MSFRNLLRHFYQPRSIFDPTKNHSQLQKMLINKYHGKYIIDVGSGKKRLANDVIAIDKFTKGDIVADALSLPIKSNSIDLALCIAVLEHLQEPYMAIEEIYRSLKNGGEVYIEIPFLQPFHASPNDFYRATLVGLKYWCRQFKEINSGVCVGPGSAIAWIEIEYVKLLFGEIPIVGLLSELLFRLWSLPLKYLDHRLIKKKDAHITASAIYFYGKKI